MIVMLYIVCRIVYCMSYCISFVSFLRSQTQSSSPSPSLCVKGRQACMSCEGLVVLYHNRWVLPCHTVLEIVYNGMMIMVGWFTLSCYCYMYVIGRDPRLVCCLENVNPYR
jgi:hypothetical protein